MIGFAFTYGQIVEIFRDRLPGVDCLCVAEGHDIRIELSFQGHKRLGLSRIFRPFMQEEREFERMATEFREACVAHVLDAFGPIGCDSRCRIPPEERDRLNGLLRPLGVQVDPIPPHIDLATERLNLVTTLQNKPF